MQWLIDLVIEAIGIPPTYIDRGDPGANDFITGQFIKDGQWRDLDLSAIVPAGATAVALSFRVRSSSAGVFVQFRKNGNMGVFNKTWFYTQIANIYYAGDMIVALDGDRKIEYQFEAVPWTSALLTVKGWWL